VSDIWHYNRITQFNEKYYRDVLQASDIVAQEMAVKNAIDDHEFYYPLKKGSGNKAVNFLVPSDQIENLPIIPTKTVKIAHNGKGYLKVINAQSVRIRPEKTMSFKQMVDSWLPYDHESPEQFTLYKLIVLTAYYKRINARILTFPGWMKDSPIEVLKGLRGDCVCVNTPSLAKLKYLLNDSNKIIGMNEIQSLNAEGKRQIAKFYEDVGDGKEEYVNPSRGSSGAVERCSIKNMSTLTFYNFPDPRIGEDKEELFDNIFRPKIKQRIFPLLFQGGSHDRSACKQEFEMPTTRIGDDQVKELTTFIRNHRYYEKYNSDEAHGWKRITKIKGNIRWNNTYKMIQNILDLYCESQEEFEKFEKILFGSHKDYLDYIGDKAADVYGQQELTIEEEII
jgi:hypothetical protein